VQGTGFGLIGDLAIGVVGAFIGDWLLPQLGIDLDSSITSAIYRCDHWGCAAVTDQ